MNMQFNANYKIILANLWAALYTDYTLYYQWTTLTYHSGWFS